MRFYCSVLPSSALLASALLCAVPAFAQQTAPSPDAPVPVTVTSAPLPAAATLAIPAPPGAKLRFEMDARSEDLLGLVKSFLKGVGEANSTARAKANAAPPATPAAPVNPIEEALENGNLADILKDVNHLHFAVWELPARPKAAAAPVAPAPALDTSTFYEGAFGAEGAHRVLYTDADEYKLVMVGFPDHHGFAFAASDLPAAGGGYVAAARADGYPNMEALSAFISQITSAVMKTKTGKQIMDSTLGGDSDTGADDKGADPKATGGKGTDKK